MDGFQRGTICSTSLDGLGVGNGSIYVIILRNERTGAQLTPRANRQTKSGSLGQVVEQV